MHEGANMQTPFMQTPFFDFYYAGLKNAADMMTRDVDTVGPDTTVREAARLIHESGHNRLPVVENGKLVGVVTRIDVLGALAA